MTINLFFWGFHDFVATAWALAYVLCVMVYIELVLGVGFSVDVVCCFDCCLI